MKYFKFALVGIAVVVTVGTVYKWWRLRKELENVEAIDNEEKNHPELRYGVYKNPAEGPSWRLEPEFLLVFSLMSTDVVMHQSKELNMAISRNKNTSREPPWMSRSDLLEGDIVVEGVMNHARASVTKQIYLWSGGLVPYVFDPSLTSYARSVITKAMRTLEKLSCVRFKKRTNEGYFVRFIGGQGCYSCIGRTMDPNGQIVSIGFGCELRGIVLHELMHTLGFFHTSSRPDRDAYVIVYTQNIKAAYRQNFKKYSHGEVDRLGAPYDVTSLMHLPKKSWSNNGRNTIQSRAGPHVILGQRRALSVVDEQQLNQLYKCSNNRGCYFAVGLEKGTITDSQLKASSSQPFLDPHQARLHLTAGPKGNGAWCAAGNAIGEYLQIDLGSIQKVTAIATQGTEDLFITSAWVSGYKIQSSINGNSLSWVTNVQFLNGNWDANSVQYNSLKTPFRARYVKILPTHWYNSICLRVELYGCK